MNPEKRQQLHQDVSGRRDASDAKYLLQPSSNMSTAERRIFEYTSTTGHLAPLDLQLCSLSAIAAYPENFIGKGNRDKVREAAFGNGKLWERKWNLFYLYPGREFKNNKAIILVPMNQFVEFLEQINQKLGTSLRIPSGAAEMSFKVKFPKDGTPRPRYLGESDSKEMADQMKTAPPPPYYKPDREAGGPKIEPTDSCVQAFRHKINALLHNEKQRKTKNKQHKKVDNLAKRKAWNDSVKRVQRYLGLRGIRTELHAVMNQPDAEVGPPVVLDVTMPPTCFMEEDLVFVCVDIEAYERNHNLITEIGVSTLDTRDLVSLAPGLDGKNWFNKIRARHFRIQEYSSLTNVDFVRGCPDRFEFGKSEFVALKDAPQLVASCFKDPFSGPGKGVQNTPKRKVVFVGHDAMADIKYLRELGYNVLNLPPHEVVDTGEMYRSLRRETSARMLGGILADLGIAGWNLHNAGNDAVYTLQAMISIAVRATKEAETREPGKVGEERLAKALEEAKSDALDEQEGWSDDGGDGGAPVKPPREINEKGKGVSGGSGNVNESKFPHRRGGFSAGRVNESRSSNPRSTALQPKHPQKIRVPFAELLELATRATKSDDAALNKEIAEHAGDRRSLFAVLVAVADGMQTSEQQAAFDIEVANVRSLLSWC